MAAKKHKKSIVLRVLVLCVCVYMVITLIGLWSDLIEKRDEKAFLEEQKLQKQIEINELMHLLDDGTEAQIIEKAARERLGYVYADEQVFIDISGN